MYQNQTNVESKTKPNENEVTYEYKIVKLKYLKKRRLPKILDAKFIGEEKQDIIESIQSPAKVAQLTNSTVLPLNRIARFNRLKSIHCKIDHANNDK